MLRFRSAACSRRRRSLGWLIGWGMRLRRVLRCERLSVLARCRCRMGSAGCGFWSGWRGGAGATWSRWRFGLGGGLGWGRWEVRLGVLVSATGAWGRVFPGGFGVARQEVLAVEAARVRVLVRAVSEGELSGALTAALQAGFDLSREVPLRAHVFALGVDEHVVLLLLHHIAGDGWSLGPLVRDLSRGYGARVRGSAADFAPLEVQYADYTLWQQAVLGDESDAGSVLSRQLSYWRERLSGLPEQIALPSDRARPAVASYRGGSVEFGLSG